MMMNKLEEDKIPREKLINLRKQLIKYDYEKSYVLTRITEALIDHPEFVTFITNRWNLPYKYIKKEVTSTGYGAFGEPESDVDYYICGRSYDNGEIILLDKDDVPVEVLKLNFNDIVEEVKKKHIESFEI